MSLGLLIIVAKLTEGVFRRLRLNSIVAYATAGNTAGPRSSVIRHLMD